MKIFMPVLLLLLIVCVGYGQTPIVELSESTVVAGDNISVSHYWDKSHGTELAFYTYRFTPVGFFHRGRGELVSIRQSVAADVRLEGPTSVTGAPSVTLAPLGRKDDVGRKDSFKANLVGMFLVRVEYTIEKDNKFTESVSDPVLLIVNPPRKDGVWDSDFIKSPKVIIHSLLHEIYEASYDKERQTEK